MKTYLFIFRFVEDIKNHFCILILNEHEVPLSARAELRLTLRRAAPLHATCTESLPLFRASGGKNLNNLQSLTTKLFYKQI